MDKQQSKQLELNQCEIAIIKYLSNVSEEELLKILQNLKKSEAEKQEKRED